MTFGRQLLRRFNAAPGPISFSPGTCFVSLILAASLLTPSASQAQKLTQYGHTAWRFQEGVFDAPPVSIAQTSDGYLWIGTLNGLIRFDGVHFESWNDRIHELHSCCALSLLGSRDGVLWIGTDQGLAKLNEGKLVAVTTGDARYNSLIEDIDGRIWAARTRIRDNKGPLCQVYGTVVKCHGQEDGIDCHFGNSLAQDKAGTIWVGDQGKVCSWKNRTAQTYVPPISDAGCNPSIESLLPDYDHSILIGCGGGLRRIDDGAFVRFRPAGIDADKLNGSKLLDDRDGGLWIGTTNDGLYHILNSVADHFGISDGLSDDNVTALYEDREGNVWVATPSGIDQFHRLNVFSFSGQHGLRNLGGSAVLSSSDGRTLWTSGLQGLTAIKDGKITTITRKEGLPGEQVTALFEDDSGVLWMGIDQNLFSYSNHRFTKKLRADGTPTGMVVGMAEDANGFLWVVTATNDYRLLRLDLKSGVAEVAGKWPGSMRVTSSPNKKVFLLSPNSGEIIMLDDRLGWEKVPLPTGPRTGRSLFVYDDESLFVATDVGLYLRRHGKWSGLTTKNNLPCEAVQDAVSDTDGNLWLHLACGFVQIARRDLDAWSRDSAIRLNLHLYDALDGARAGRASFDLAHARTANGQLWFAGGSGLLQMIDPKHLVHNDLPPPVHILRMIADHRTIGSLSNVRLPALTRDIEVDYAALSLVASEKVRFRYVLWGADSDWQDAGSRREAYYMNLRPGQYRFQVIASNNDGVWNEEGAALDFYIAPAFYQTNWFRALFAFTVLMIVSTAHQLRVRRLQHQFEMTLDARVSERTRIARELHDTLLQSFHGLLLRFQTVSQLLPNRPSEAKDKLDAAIGQAAEAITEGRDAVQGLRDSTVERNDLGVAISTLGEELIDRASDERPAFHVAVQGTPRNLHPILRDEIYKIAAEALRNAFHHAQARHVEVELRYDDEQFWLRVRDDGKGIDSAILAQRTKDGHFGLRGMQERAKLMGANLAIWSEVDAGAEVELSMPGNLAYAKEKNPWYARFAAKG